MSSEVSGSSSASAYSPDGRDPQHSFQARVGTDHLHPLISAVPTHLWMEMRANVCIYVCACCRVEVAGKGVVAEAVGGVEDVGAEEVVEGTAPADCATWECVLCALAMTT